MMKQAMRALKDQGYMHNRNRMIVAMFLAKDLMLDWRLGEKWFMQNLIDGDLASKLVLPPSNRLRRITDGLFMTLR